METEIKEIKGGARLAARQVRKTRRTILVIILVVVIVAVGVILFLDKEAAKYSLGEAVFYYKGESADSKLFYMLPGQEPGYLITLPSEEIELDKYKVPQHSYISNSGEILIYFEKTEEVPIEDIGDGLTAYRKIYQPKLVDLRNGSVKNIEENIDSGSLVFSLDDKDIAWVLRAEESTIQELESAEKKREIWLSNPDGNNARHLAALDEKVVLLQKWYDNYIYFWGIQGIGYYSLGRIDVRNGRVTYLQPKYCSENLANCQNFHFSPSGDLFLYEAGIIKEDDGEGVELFIESFDGKRSWQILVANYMSDRLWMPNEKSIIYTEQLTERGVGLREKIHLVNLETKEDKEIYSGSYLSQLVPGISSKYLYFIEKETDEKFNLIRLDIENNGTTIIDSGPYNQLKIFTR